MYLIQYYKKYKSISFALGSIITAVILAGCSDSDVSDYSNRSISVVEVAETETENEDDFEGITYDNIWVVHWNQDDPIWQLENNEDIRTKRVTLFEAYFDGEDKIVIPDETNVQKWTMGTTDKMSQIPIYLSVSNDIVTGEYSVLKDTDLLYRLFENEETISAHVDGLIHAAKDNGYDGLEIDYESIYSDMELWNKYIPFVQKLIDEAEKEELPVRIILEPSTPFSELNFPDGAEYEVMCYNLKGPGTDPGPKADFSFLDEIVEKTSDMPNIGFALSNGGYKWRDTDFNDITALEDDTIQEIIDEVQPDIHRDEESYALWFNYKEEYKEIVTQENGEKSEIIQEVYYTIWYSDQETLNAWRERLNETSGREVAISLWCM